MLIISDAGLDSSSSRLLASKILLAIRSVTRSATRAPIRQGGRS